VKFAVTAIIIFLLTACQTDPVTPTAAFTVEASGGTYIQQLGAGSQTTSLGTAIVVKIRAADRKLITDPVKVVITGPKTWNGGQTLVFTYPAKAYWVMAPRVQSTPVVGEYLIKANFLNAIETKFELKANQKPLAITPITATIKGDAPNQSVEANWEPVPGAVGYYARVLDGTKGIAVSDDAFTLTPNAEIPVDLLSPSRAYFVTVVASTIDTVANDPTIAGDFNVSDSITALSLSQQRVIGPLALKPVFRLGKVTKFSVNPQEER
jgi:hypothetical protein